LIDIKISDYFSIFEWGIRFILMDPLLKLAQIKARLYPAG